MKTLTENLSRARLTPEAASMRAATTDGDAGDGRTLFGHFSVFNTWYEVNSMWEGNFLERIAPGSFTQTIADRGGQVKALYDHGHDPQIGNKPLGAFKELSEDDTGGYYEIGLIETSYNNDFVIPASRAGLLGSSFRFTVNAESWVDTPKASKDNPRALPERTITGVDLFELGPVTFPANPEATAALRSTTDDFFERLLHDPLFVSRFTERVGPKVVQQMLENLPPDGRSAHVRPHVSDDVQPRVTPARSVRAGQATLEAIRLPVAREGS